MKVESFVGAKSWFVDFCIPLQVAEHTLTL